jgi:hypothetical protein
MPMNSLKTYRKHGMNWSRMCWRTWWTACREDSRQ